MLTRFAITYRAENKTAAVAGDMLAPQKIGIMSHPDILSHETTILMFATGMKHTRGGDLEGPEDTPVNYTTKLSEAQASFNMLRLTTKDKSKKDLADSKGDSEEDPAVKLNLVNTVSVEDAGGRLARDADGILLVKTHIPTCYLPSNPNLETLNVFDKGCRKVKGYFQKK